MSPWQIRFEQRLAAPDAPPVLSRDLLVRYARVARGSTVPVSSLSHWLKQAQARGRIQAVQRGLFLNQFRTPPPQLADATPWLRRDAVVSLNTVLGDSGVLNNPSHTVTAVVPIDRQAPPPRLGRQATAAGVIHFFGLPRRILEAGTVPERLESGASFEHPRATPEKALIDWLYLGASHHSHRSFPPVADMDMSLLDLKRLRRLAKTMGITEVLNAWLST